MPGLPFRFGPPPSAIDLVERPRLLDAIGRRFERRLVLLTAGPGSGKTTLLAQAVAHNRLDPQGEDVWLTLGPDDAFADVIGAGLTHALGGTPDTTNAPDPVETVSEIVLSRSPSSVALILDDAHHLVEGSPGAALLRDLIVSLPANGHIVVSSRTPIDAPVAKLDAAGEVVRLGEGDLHLSADELETFALLRGADRSTLQPLGGWPALVELAARSGSSGALGFVREEALRPLPVERRRALACLATIGSGDAEVAEALLSDDATARDVLDGLPLTTVGADGSWSVHAIWNDALVDELSVEDRRTVGTRAADLLRRRGEIGQALAILRGLGAHERFLDTLLDAFAPDHITEPVAVLRRWLEGFPRRSVDTPHHRLVEALIVREQDPTRASRLLDEAAQAFARDGNARGEVAALLQRGMIAFYQRDIDRLIEIVTRFDVLSDVHPPAAPLVALGEAAAAEASFRHADALDRLGLVPPGSLAGGWAAIADYIRSTALLNLGRAEEAAVVAGHAASAAPPALWPTAAGEELAALHASGALDDPQRVDTLVSAFDALGVVMNTARARSQAAMIAAFDGRVDDARQHIAAGKREARPGLLTATTALPMAEAVCAVVEGDEETARELLRASVGEDMGSPGVEITHRRAIALTYVLLPETRAFWDEAHLAGCWAEARGLARRLVGLRDRRSAPVAAWPPPSVVLAHLPLPWAVELAVGGGEPGHALLRSIGPRARPIVERLAFRSGGGGARDALRSIPALPAHRVHVRVLGPAELLRDGAPVTEAAWRRRRVRELLAYLVVHRDTARPAAAAALWPDLDERRAANNLRTTLMHLLKLLEPDKPQRAPSYFIRSEADRLTLTPVPELVVDAWEIEGALDEAADAEASGAPTRALGAYARAIGLWDGAVLDDVRLSAWAVTPAADLTQRFANAAVRAAELWLASRSPADALTAARAAMSADPWSERAFRVAAQAHLAAGDRSSAADTLQRGLDMLRELGVDPVTETVQLSAHLTAART